MNSQSEVVIDPAILAKLGKVREHMPVDRQPARGSALGNPMNPTSGGIVKTLEPGKSYDATISLKVP